MPKAMTKSQVLAEIRNTRIVAVVRAASSEQAINAARALLRGGVRGIEITSTVPGAWEVIKELAGDDDLWSQGMLLGAGTITSTEQAHLAVEAGAQFLVSPATIPEVIAMAREADIAMLPGALTPTEVFQAHSLGGDIIKLFPATRFGPAYLKDLRGPFPNIPLMPTGGVDVSNVREWLAAGAVALGVGGNLVDSNALKNGDWDTITTRAVALVEALPLQV